MQREWILHDFTALRFPGSSVHRRETCEPGTEAWKNSDGLGLNSWSLTVWYDEYVHKRYNSMCMFLCVCVCQSICVCSILICTQ